MRSLTWNSCKRFHIGVHYLEQSYSTNILKSSLELFLSRWRLLLSLAPRVAFADAQGRSPLRVERNVEGAEQRVGI